MSSKNKKASKLKSIFTNKITVSILACVLAVGFCSYFAWIGVQKAEINRLEIQKNELSQKLDEQNKTNEELSEALAEDNKDKFIEQKAREKGYVKSDEIVFYDTGSTE